MVPIKEFFSFHHRSVQPALPHSVYTLTCTYDTNLSPFGTVANAHLPSSLPQPPTINRGIRYLWQYFRHRV